MYGLDVRKRERVVVGAFPAMETEMSPAEGTNGWMQESLAPDAAQFGLFNLGGGQGWWGVKRMFGLD